MSDMFWWVVTCMAFFDVSFALMVISGIGHAKYESSDNA